MFSYQESKNESLKNTGFRYSRVRGKKLKMFCSKLWKKYRFGFFGAFGRSTAEILYRVQFEWRTSIQRKNTAEYSQPNGLLHFAGQLNFLIYLYILHFRYLANSTNKGMVCAKHKACFGRASQADEERSQPQKTCCAGVWAKNVPKTLP